MMMMKRNSIFAVALAATLVLSGCGTMGNGAASGGILGAQFGSILGSAIGGISGGPRGSDIGTIVGMAGGAVVGAAVGSTADKAQRERNTIGYNANNGRDAYVDSNNGGAADIDNGTSGNDDSESGFDPGNGGDDVIQFDAPADNASAPEQPFAANDSKTSADMAANADETADIAIRNVRFLGSDGNMAIRRGELAEIVVEVYNNTSEAIYNVEPMIMETTGNRHLFLSAQVIVEKIAPGKGIRYTAMVKADNKLKDGKAHFKVYARASERHHNSEMMEFDVTTAK